MENTTKETNYIIISKPNKVNLTCPYCNENIEVPFDEVDYNTDYWGDGGWVTCPECDEEILLGDYEYD